ncbi:hypothetical protein RJ640_002928, partial [Escallonia rubra]
WIVEVAELTASLVARWQGVGFTHGVLNTDNMSVLGLTIDYGPFGFLDAFDPSFTPNTTDLPGRRYCFANQPDIGLWNIAQFASTLSSAQLINDKEANYAMERYGTKFMDEYQSIMTRKLGLPKYNKQLISKLLNNMAVDKVDYTNFFRLLSNIKADPSIPEDQLLVPLKAVLLDIGKERKDAWTSWLSSSDIPDEERKASMNSVNPKYILRNYLCQSAIDAAETGDFGEVRRLLKVMERPYDDQPGMEKYARLPPAWAYRPGSSNMHALPSFLKRDLHVKQLQIKLPNHHPSQSIPTERSPSRRLLVSLTSLPADLNKFRAATKVDGSNGVCGVGGVVMGAALEANEYPHQTRTKPQHVSTSIGGGSSNGVNGAGRRRWVLYRRPFLPAVAGVVGTVQVFMPVGF